MEKILKVKEWLVERRIDNLSKVFLNWKPIAVANLNSVPDLELFEPMEGEPKIELMYLDFKYGQ